jgi:hypothetical protein
VMTQHPAHVSEQAAPASAPPLGQFYEVAGRRLWLHRSGRGGPAVVFLPGASAVGLDYLNIGDQAAELTTSVLYDRGGTGWSDPAELPRTAAEVATELRDLLAAADVPLIALTPLGIDPGMRLLMSGKALREMTEGKRRLYAALADSVTRGEHRVLDDARHSTITTDHPEAVIRAIHDLLDEVRAENE